MIFSLIALAAAEDPAAQVQQAFEREFAYVLAEKRMLEQRKENAYKAHQAKIKSLELELVDAAVAVAVAASRN